MGDPCPCAGVWSPGRIPAGRRVDDLALLFDFGPAILDLAGLQPPKWMEARSFMPYLNGGAPVPRRHVFAKHAGDKVFHGAQFMTMIRGHDYKLVRFIDTDEGQLFDLRADPQELPNLWADPARQSKRRKLIGEILKWRIRSDLQTQGWTEAIRAPAWP